jgi:hypothetical protein
MRFTDQLFKWAVLLVACGYLYVLSRYVQSERYTSVPQAGLAGMYHSVLLDKQTGMLYGWKSALIPESWLEFHPQTGETIEYPIRMGK